MKSMVNYFASQTARARLIQRLFPEGIPALWCPPLTHYDERAMIDVARMEAHLRHLAPHAKGLLAPSSTGDGWDLGPAERRWVLEIVLEQAQKLGLHVLIGVLEAETAEAVAVIRDDVAWLKKRSGEGETIAALAKARVCGFTVCPPRGQERSQAEILQGLSQVLELGFPTALYQLPQMTRNEMSPEVAAGLAERFSNFIFFKDSSGADRVALSGKYLGGVFTTRGGEGDYERWLKAAGGPYDGFLLGSANCFAREHAQVIAYLRSGKIESARPVAGRVTAVVGEVARLVRSAAGASAFAQANKAIDHFFAYGPRGTDAPPPRLHDGSQVPQEMITATGESLARHSLMPERGYLD